SLALKLFSSRATRAGAARGLGKRNSGQLSHSTARSQAQRRLSSSLCSTGFHVMGIFRKPQKWPILGIAPSRMQAVEHAGKRDRLADMLEAANPRHCALQSHAEAGMRHRAELAQVHIPVERLLRQIVLFDPLSEQLQAGDALPTADDLAVTLRSEHVHAER